MLRHALRSPWIAAGLLMAFGLASAVGGQDKRGDHGPGGLRLDVSVEAADPFDKANEQQPVNGPVKVARGSNVRIRVTGTPPRGMRTYPVHLPAGHQQEEVSLVRLNGVQGIVPVGPLVESPPSKVVRTNDKGEQHVSLEHDQPFSWTQEVRVGPDAGLGRVTLPIQVKTQVCDDNHCIPVRTAVEAVFEVRAATGAETAVNVAKAEVELKPAERAAPALAQLPNAEAGGYVGLITASATEYRERMLEQLPTQLLPPGEPADADSGLYAFLLAGIFWGAISLITPCVFPMIPITVSFFLKQSEKEHHRPIVMASVYSLTIVIVLTVAAAALLSFFRVLSIHPATNFFLGGLFVFFALSLFGMYEIELPHFLARYTSAHEGKGGLVGTMFMALTFTIISFTCVAPFLGGFGGAAASARPWWHNILGGLAFSATFASPFFLLALFPSLLRAMPKSGSWLNSVKVVMGFLEVAAALKFFRTAELRLVERPEFFTFDLVLGIWIALCLLSALYLIGAYRLPHDTPSDSISVPRLLFTIAFLALAFYLLPALFKVNGSGEPQRPTGTVYAWVDSFLLPDTVGAAESGQVTGNLPYAIHQAREQRQRTGEAKRIFVDFTGKTCTNCKINERNVFPKPEVRDLLKRYQVVQLFTDTIPEEMYAAPARTPGRTDADAGVNLDFQAKVFNNEQLPLYAILEPRTDGKTQIVAVYDEGRINNVEKFIQFLKTP